MNRFTFYLLFVVLCLNSTVRASLIARWSGDGTPNDSVAGRNGTLENGATYDTGKFGQAFRLDGVDDYVSVPDDSVWTFSSDFTISLWANFDAIGAGNFPNRMLGHDNGPGETNKWIFAFDEDGSLHFHKNGPISGGYGVGGDDMTHPGTISVTTGEWIHFSVTRTGFLYTFYANGQALGSQTSFLSILDASAPLTIGQAEGNGYFDGRLDEIRIYDEALSVSEIRQLAGITPEPSTFALSIFALLSLGFSRRERSRR